MDSQTRPRSRLWGQGLLLVLVVALYAWAWVRPDALRSVQLPSPEGLISLSQPRTSRLLNYGLARYDLAGEPEAARARLEAALAAEGWSPGGGDDEWQRGRLQLELRVQPAEPGTSEQTPIVVLVTRR